MLQDGLVSISGHEDGGGHRRPHQAEWQHDAQAKTNSSQGPSFAAGPDLAQPVSAAVTIKEKRGELIFKSTHI